MLKKAIWGKSRQSHERDSNVDLEKNCAMLEKRDP